MTDEQWAAEVLDALSGTAWRPYYLRVARDGSECFAHVMHASGREHTMRLPCDRFDTAAKRAVEIHRQLEQVAGS